MRETSLSDIVQGWKSFTSKKINAVLGRTGKIWQADYWDRYIRNDEHYAAAVKYIQNNALGAPKRPGKTPIPAALRAQAQPFLSQIQKRMRARRPRSQEMSNVKVATGSTLLLGS